MGTGEQHTMSECEEWYAGRPQVTVCVMCKVHGIWRGHQACRSWCGWSSHIFTSPTMRPQWININKTWITAGESTTKNLSLCLHWCRPMHHSPLIAVHNNTIHGPSVSCSVSPKGWTTLVLLVLRLQYTLQHPRRRRRRHHFPLTVRDPFSTHIHSLTHSHTLAFISLCIINRPQVRTHTARDDSSSECPNVTHSPPPRYSPRPKYQPLWFIFLILQCASKFITIRVHAFSPHTGMRTIVCEHRTVCFALAIYLGYLGCSGFHHKRYEICIGLVYVNDYFKPNIFEVIIKVSAVWGEMGKVDICRIDLDVACEAADICEWGVVFILM